MTQNAVTRTRRTLMTLVLLTLLAAANAFAQPQVTSRELLLSSFEVDLSGAGRTTFLSLVNSSARPAEVDLIVYSNWGIEILRTRASFNAHQSRSFNLADWLIRGRLPDRALSAEQLEHAQAALSGRLSPKSGLYYSTETAIELAAGSVRMRTISGAGEIFGDYFVFDPLGDNAEGDLLLDTSPATCVGPACLSHGLRFFLGGALNTDTEFIVWSARPSQPSDNPFFLARQKIDAELYVYRQDGELLEIRSMRFLPLETVKVSELGLDARGGWIRLITAEATFVAVRYSADERFSIGLRAVCLPPEEPDDEEEDPDPKASIRIEKSTNGDDADAEPGPTLQPGSDVLWEYEVTNTGTEALIDVVVTDDQGVAVDCPQDELAVDESMICTGEGVAISGQYANLGIVEAKGAETGDDATDTDPSHYFGDGPGPVPSVEIEKSTNGEDADQIPGPTILVGEPVSWTYEVTNGEIALFDVEVTDDQGVVVDCPKTTLESFEVMTCHGNGTATEGQYENLGTVIGDAMVNGNLVEGITASDPSHYFGEIVTHPEIDIEKATNGDDADTVTGPKLQVGDPVTWTYVVTNTGDVDLTNVTVHDDKEGAVSCPTSFLSVDQSMTCSASGTAIEGQYENFGTATGTYDGQDVSDSDPSHYLGEKPEPQNQRMTGGGSVFTNGERYTHGFELHCDASNPNNLEINWGQGRANQFHLTNLASANCYDDPSIVEAPPVAGFDTFVGTGTGRFNGENGATITFKFTDAGEPGKSDLAEFTIVPPGGGSAIVVSGSLQNGNHQAHGN